VKRLLRIPFPFKLVLQSDLNNVFAPQEVHIMQNTTPEMVNVMQIIFNIYSAIIFGVFDHNFVENMQMTYDLCYIFSF
jgi:hypothetical protein